MKKLACALLLLLLLDKKDKWKRAGNDKKHLEELSRLQPLLLHLVNAAAPNCWWQM